MAMMSTGDTNEEMSQEDNNVPLEGTFPVVVPVPIESSEEFDNIDKLISEPEHQLFEELNKLQAFFVENDCQAENRESVGTNCMELQSTEIEVPEHDVSIAPGCDLKSLETGQHIQTLETVCSVNAGSSSPISQQPVQQAYQDGSSEQEEQLNVKHVELSQEGQLNFTLSPEKLGALETNSASENESVVAISQNDLELSFKRSCKVVLKRCDLRRSRSKSEKSCSDDYLSENESFESEGEVKLVQENHHEEIIKSETDNTTEPNHDVVNDSSQTIVKPKGKRGPKPKNPLNRPDGQIQGQRKKITKKRSSVDDRSKLKKYLDANIIKEVPGGRVCLLCGKFFKHAFNVIVHVRIHTGERPFQCPVVECGLRFRQFAHAQKHCRKVHKKEVSRSDVEIVEKKMQGNLKGPLQDVQSPEKHGASPRKNPETTPMATDQNQLVSLCSEEIKSVCKNEVGVVPLTEEEGECSEKKPDNNVINNFRINTVESGPVVKKPVHWRKRRNQLNTDELKLRQYIEANLVKQVSQSQYVCQPCGKLFPCRWNVVVHVRIHTGEKPFGCPFGCDNLRFRQYSHAQRHCIRHHNREVSKHEVEIPEEGGPNFNGNLLNVGSDKNNTPWQDFETRPLETKNEGTENLIQTPTSRETNIVGSRDEITPMKGVLRLQHPDIQGMVAVEEDLLLHFLKPFLNSSDSPLKRDPEDYPDNGKELILSEVHAQLNEVWGTEKDSDEEDEVGLSQEEMEDFPQRFEIPRRKPAMPTPPKIRTYTCNFCGLKYSNIAQLLLHKRSRHGGANAERLKSSMVNIGNTVLNGNKDFTCNGCQKGFANSYNLERHIKQSCEFRGMPPWKKVVDALPGEVVKTNSNSVKEEIKISDAETNIKPKIVEGEINDRSIKKAKVANRPYPCDSCNRKFTRPEFLQKHINLKHNKAETRVIKKEKINGNESETVEAKMNGKSTKKVPKRSYPYPCNFCNKKFSRPEFRHNHMRLEHEEKSEERFSCQHCKLKFLQADLVNHVKTVHPNGKGGLCWVCGKGFSTSEELHEHKLLCQRNRPHVCQICNKSFARNDILRNHLLVHSGERPFACKICKKSFKRKSTLSVHSLRHSENRLVFACERCDKKFTRKSSLYKHVWFVHEERDKR